jgi:hypothetical protein
MISFGRLEGSVMARDQEEYGTKEAKRRFEAALRGARIAGPQHKVSVTPKRPKVQRKAKKNEPK